MCPRVHSHVGTGWFPQANVPGDGFTVLSLISQLAHLGIIELGMNADAPPLAMAGESEESAELSARIRAEESAEATDEYDRYMAEL